LCDVINFHKKSTTEIKGQLQTMAKKGASKYSVVTIAL